MISRVAVGSYASKLVKGFNEGLTENRVVVYGPKGEPRSEPYIQLVQLWTPIAYPFQILRRICQDKPDVVHVQHEFGMFGSPLTLTLSPLLYMFLKLLRVRLVTTLHSLVFPDALSKDSIRALSPSTSWMPKTIVEIGLHVVYGSACRLSDLVIVHQQSQKEKLEKYYHIRGPKIALVPHGVGPTEYVADQESLSGWRSKLDQRRLML